MWFKLIEGFHLEKVVLDLRIDALILGDPPQIRKQLQETVEVVAEERLRRWVAHGFIDKPHELDAFLLVARVALIDRFTQLLDFFVCVWIGFWFCVRLYLGHWCL